MAIDPSFVEQQAQERERTTNFRSGERWVNGVLVSGSPVRPPSAPEQAEPGWGRRSGDVAQEIEQRVLNLAAQEGPMTYALLKGIARLRDAPSYIDLLEWMDEARTLSLGRGGYSVRADDAPVVEAAPSNEAPPKPKRILSEKQKTHMRRMLDTRWGAKRQTSEQPNGQA